MKNIFFFALVLFFAFTSAKGAEFSANVMAPLAVGNINDPNGADSGQAWAEFRSQLQMMKKLGASAVSTDVWWGVVEAQDGKFQWAYYDKLSDEIIAAGMKWVPILSFHQCGGNVGDTCDFPIPAWIWKKHIGEPGVANEDSLKYRSEDDHLSSETVSVWGTRIIAGDYQKFMTAFQAHFAGKAAQIVEINISLGPAGELRYPAYNSHDPGAGYPSRGRLQAYSDLARASFSAFMQSKYGPDFAHYGPPDDGFVPRAGAFFDHGDATTTQFGKDFFDWYNGSLIQHGETVLALAKNVFGGPVSAFGGIAIGAKIPGIHWRMAIDRASEMTAGLIPTSRNDLNDDSHGHGYAAILGLFKKLNIVVHFTCLEMENHMGGPSVGSEAKNLVFWVAQEAHRQGLVIKGENALNGAVFDDRAWDTMDNALRWAGYSGITILRLTDIYQSGTGQTRFSQIARDHSF